MDSSVSNGGGVKPATAFSTEFTVGADDDATGTIGRPVTMVRTKKLLHRSGRPFFCTLCLKHAFHKRYSLPHRAAKVRNVASEADQYLCLRCG